MSRKVQTEKLNEAIKKLQTAKIFIQNKQLKHAKYQIHEVVSNCGSIFNKKVIQKRKSSK